jgi:hypothetical protein
MPLYSYRYGPCTIGSRLIFPELSEVADRNPSLTFRVCEGPAPVTRSINVRKWMTNDGRVHASLHQTVDGHLIHFKRRARFQVSRNLEMIRCTPSRFVTMPLVRHLFLDQVMPLVLSLRGRHVIHASAVEYDGDAVAFVGESGAGKSTIAAALGQNGSRIVADDAIVIEECGNRFLVRAPYRSLRLWDDSAATLDLGRGRAGHRTGKRRFPSHRRLSFATGPSPLAAVCLLSRSTSTDRAALTRLGGPEALVMLVRHGFKFDVSERSSLEREFKFLSRLVASVRCYRMTIPDSLKELPSLSTLVIDAIQFARARQIA